MKSICRLFLCTLIAFIVSMPTYAKNKAPVTSSEWSADWWQWAASSDPAKPAEDGYIDCREGQKGKVWFLAGSWGIPVERTCIYPIPKGKVLFFPLVNAAWNNPPWQEYMTVAEKRGFLRDELIDPLACKMSLTIDGEKIELTSPIVVKTQSPPFTGTFVELNTNTGEYEEFTDDEAVSDGYWVTLSSLDEGEHTIHFTGGYCAYKFFVDVTYHLTIE